MEACWAGLSGNNLLWRAQRLLYSEHTGIMVAMKHWRLSHSKASLFIWNLNLTRHPIFYLATLMMYNLHTAHCIPRAIQKQLVTVTTTYTTPTRNSNSISAPKAEEVYEVQFLVIASHSLDCLLQGLWLSHILQGSLPLPLIQNSWTIFSCQPSLQVEASRGDRAWEEGNQGTALI